MTRGGTGSGRSGEGWRRAGDVTLRAVAALPLGYAVGGLWAMLLARVLPMAPAQASIAATLLSFAICAVAAMWAFAARSGWWATWTLTLAGAVAGLGTWASIAATGRL